MHTYICLSLPNAIAVKKSNGQLSIFHLVAVDPYPVSGDQTVWDGQIGEGQLSLVDIPTDLSRAWVLHGCLTYHGHLHYKSLVLSSDLYYRITIRPDFIYT